jgi:ketosteroid isomerase-like protein
MSTLRQHVDAFFDRYAQALLARDAEALARMYAVPALIIFPGQSIPVNDARETEKFFASAFDQYEGVREVEKQLVIMGEAPGTVWADVTWSYANRPPERFCYQLVDAPESYRIAVLTLMAAN